MENLIKIIESLLVGVKELNGEFQDGWDEEIMVAEQAIEKYYKEK